MIPAALFFLGVACFFKNGAEVHASSYYVEYAVVAKEYNYLDRVPVNEGKTLCLTPDDIIHYEADCPQPVCDESGCFFQTCQYEDFGVSWKEVNNGTTNIDAGYRTDIVYDGVTILQKTMDVISAGEYRVVPPVGLRYLGISDIPGVDYWGPVDADPHTLEIVSYFQDGNVTTEHRYSLTLRYCNFTGYDCSCGVDMSGSSGLTIGSSWHWDWGQATTCIHCYKAGDPTNCIYPEYTTYQSTSVTNGWTVTSNQVQGVTIKFKEEEILDMFGREAYAKGYTTAENVVSRFSLTTYYANYYNPPTDTLVTTSPTFFGPGEQKETEYFLPLPDLDNSVRSFDLEVESTFANTEFSELNYYTVAFRMCWPATGVIPQAILTITDQRTTLAYIDLMFTEHVSGVVLPDIVFAEGCYVRDYTVLETDRSYTLELQYTKDICTVMVPHGMVTDAEGNTNPDSEPVSIEWPGHTTVGGIEIAGNLVPWGGTLCLTPEDLVSFTANCPQSDCTEGGCKWPQCGYEKFEVIYVEINEGVEPVTVTDPATSNETRRNWLLYDGVKIDFVDTDPLQPYATTARFRDIYYEGPELWWASYWGPVDSAPHNISLMVNVGETGPNKTVGTVSLRYCGFAGFECSCGVELEARLGMNITTPDFFWGWNSTTGCIGPKDTEIINGTEGFMVSFFEEETENMYGQKALGSGYTSANPAFRSQLNLTAVDLVNGTVNNTVSEVVLLDLGPKEMQPGEVLEHSVFVPLVPLNQQVYQFRLELDTQSVVQREFMENNSYVLTWQLCWPPDLVPGDNITLLPPKSGSALPAPPIEVEFGGEVCLTPYYTEMSGVDASETHTFFNFLYNEINHGVDTAVGVPEEEAVNGTYGTKGWYNMFYWDGVPIHPHLERPPLPGMGFGRQTSVTLDLGAPDNDTHLLEVMLDDGHEVKWRSEEWKEYNNRANITVRFCGWGTDLVADRGFRFHGLRWADWGTRRCVTDADIVHEIEHTVYGEGGPNVVGEKTA
ncbi:hypothetical protein CYMTET_11886 [Cymbomonas tetramitiformis]|uniref:Uncharacterized protein n=1 Tax=Cymbomonas tetramitiformis TaxID=36881 RepID=A0AAE0GLL8_9CHLO|nr:hypothetical protein CYMTET_11886 [Cymbomonas tetramitiformis]